MPRLEVRPAERLRAKLPKRGNRSRPRTLKRRTAGYRDYVQLATSVKIARSGYYAACSGTERCPCQLQRQFEEPAGVAPVDAGVADVDLVNVGEEGELVQHTPHVAVARRC